jgi:hypothetical protein
MLDISFDSKSGIESGRTPEIGVGEPWVGSLDWEEERDCVVETCVCRVDRLSVSWNTTDMANRAYLGLESHSRSGEVSFRFLLNERPRLTHWNHHCAGCQSISTLITRVRHTSTKL